MSDTPQGGWWKASDGKWYPPESHPDQTVRGGADPFSEIPSAPPAAGWWQASDGNWYPPDSEPGYTAEMQENLGADIGADVHANPAEPEVVLSEPEIDLTAHPDITTDDASFDLGVHGSDATVSRSLWGDSVTTAAPPLAPSVSDDLDTTPPMVEPPSVVGFDDSPEVPAIDVPSAFVVPEQPVEPPGPSLPSAFETSGPANDYSVPDSLPSPFSTPSGPLPTGPSSFGVPPADDEVPSRSLFDSPRTPAAAPDPYVLPASDDLALGLPDDLVVSPASPFAVPADSDPAEVSSTFGAPPAIDDSSVMAGLDSSTMAPFALEPEYAPEAPSEIDLQRGLFDLDDSPVEPTTKRPLFGGTTSSTFDQPQPITFDSGATSAPPAKPSKPVRTSGSRGRAFVVLGVLAGLVIIAGLAYFFLGRGDDDTSESATTLTSTSVPGEAPDSSPSGGPGGTNPLPTPVENVPQATGIGDTTFDMGTDVAGELLALITHDGPGMVSVELLDSNGSVVQQLAGPDVSGQYLGVAPVNFVQGQSFRSVRFDGEGPWAVTFAVPSSAPALGTSPGSSFSEAGDRVISVNSTEPLRIQASCAECTQPLQVRAWPIAATAPPAVVTADSGPFDVPVGTAYLQVTAPGATSTMPIWTFVVG